MTIWGGGCASVETQESGQGFSVTLETSVPRLDDMSLYQMLRLMIFLKERAAQGTPCSCIEILERLYWPHDTGYFISSGDQPRLKEILSWIRNHEIIAGRPDLSAMVRIGRQSRQLEANRQESIRYWQIHNIHDISCLTYRRIPFRSCSNIDSPYILGTPAYGSDFLEWHPEGRIIIRDIQSLRNCIPILFGNHIVGRFRRYSPQELELVRNMLLEEEFCPNDLRRMPIQICDECIRMDEFATLRIN